MKSATSYIEWERIIEPVFGDDGDEDGEREYILISKLWIAPAERGSGKARRLLRSAIAEIKRAYPVLDIKLSASGELDKTTDLARLVKFYECEGFTVDDQPDSPSITMIYTGRI
jgi:predicted GNAT family N-acyltransferase